ncbi:phage tail sheath subtilisin-like domain-containing protein [Spirulina subsalsa FACHB-351]|uniref:Phage tail sheath subtilisin-like domain-containing protein n=1 Tax=Spirulina subsalsa FACHB-351 TaxID=234711 RepID=A0ABT3L9C6_9CYAN|nr:phage tail sheath C-terminal domain-containing protein [Spirulina subsalsa]MCW6038100.1 phage tail sheath subtilisin-like domain-containing protein [Spirulina subsalsa FACHB-351]
MARLDYFAPGVYIEEVNRGSRPIEGVPTAIAGFVGFTEDIRGGAEPFKPMLVTTWDQYLQYFGRPNSDGFTDFNAYLPFSVYGWFLNGGGRCWITSIGTQLPGTPAPALEETGTQVNNRRKRPSLRFSLRSDESRSNGNGNGSSITPRSYNEMLAHPTPSLRIRINDSTPKTPEGESPLPDNTGEYFRVIVMDGDTELERYDHLTMNPDTDPQVADYVVTAFQESPSLLVTDLSQLGSPLARRPSNGMYEVSPPPFVPSPERFNDSVRGVRDDRTGVQGLFEIDEITILACPDLMRAYEANLINLDQVHGIMDLMVSMCEGAASGDIPNPPNRMVVLDTPPDLYKPQDVSQWLSQEFNRRSQFAALYYPWVLVPNPRNQGRPIAVPPCGHVMGVWSRTDETRGIYKAPANEVPRGVTGLTYDCNFREQELLNPIGINCIRTFPNRGIRIWGSRTLVEPEITEWRYIPVRRLMSYIEKSVELGTQWAVFEPNDEDLWARITRTISDFLTGLWRQGALMGASPSEAFYVKCDEELNTPDTMILGRLYVEVGVAPVRPAEFVIFRFSQWTGQDEG